VILDLMLPGKHGFDILQKFRESSDVPVLILTARQETDRKVRGFELGGDDYLTKPFWPEELVARVRARLRRPVLQRGPSRRVGPIALDFEGRRVAVDGQPVEMTRVEFDILERLANRPGTAVSRRDLADSALEEGAEVDGRTLDVHISRIRKKLGDAAGHLETVWGIGYRLVDNPETRDADQDKTEGT
jgi:two-component system response regulator MtrA